MTDAAFRFLLGGVFVSLFAALGSAFQPKTFAGLFGASPPIALVSLAVAFDRHAVGHVRALTSSMLLGAVALGIYGVLCAVLAQKRRLPVAVGAVASWVAWGAVACGLCALVKGFHLP